MHMLPSWVPVLWLKGHAKFLIWSSFFSSCHCRYSWSNFGSDEKRCSWREQMSNACDGWGELVTQSNIVLWRCLAVYIQYSALMTYWQQHHKVTKLCTDGALYQIYGWNFLPSSSNAPFSHFLENMVNFIFMSVLVMLKAKKEFVAKIEAQLDL